MIQVGLLGCGTVGSGVVKVLQKNAASIAHNVGEEVCLKWVLDRNPEKCLALGLKPEQITDNVETIINDPEVSIVIELIGGTKVAYDFITAAIKKKKNIVTANKDLIASRGKELFALAAENQVDIYYEASVAGGIPIIMPMKQSLAANEVQEIVGILNGTTNFILTKMTQEGSDYADVLKEAQRLGYAESDPTADVEGLDAGRKVAILASIAFNAWVTFDDVHCEGISKINALDIKIADRMGYNIKLLGITRMIDGKILACVYPAFVPKTHALASVHDSFNAVFYRGDAVGDVMLYGRGAGQLPTASSVVGDVMDVARNVSENCVGRALCKYRDNPEMMDLGDMDNKFYIRMNVSDEPGVLGTIAGVLGSNKVSIESVIQETDQKGSADLIVITHDVIEKSMRAALRAIENLNIVNEVGNVIRVYGD